MATEHELLSFIFWAMCGTALGVVIGILLFLSEFVRSIARTHVSFRGITLMKKLT